MNVKSLVVSGCLARYYFAFSDQQFSYDQIEQQNRMFSSYFAKVFFALSIFIHHVEMTCINDPRCSDCRIYYILTSIGLLGYSSCNKCVQNRTINNQTNVCECSLGYYDTGSTYCTKCPVYCSTCTNANTCTSCDANLNRQLVSGNCTCIDGYSQKNNSKTNACECSLGYYQTDSTYCTKCPVYCSACTDANTCTSCDATSNRQLVSNNCTCIDGYQQKNGGLVCTQKPNLLVIILSSVGSTICMILGFVICAFVRMRRGSQQVHAETKKRKTTNVEAEIQMYYEQNDQNGMANNASNMLWNSKSIAFKPQQICSICLDTNALFMTSCGHYFHSKCIYSWLSNKTACPNCNKQIEAKQVRRWCDRCKKVLMPVIMNITIKRAGGKKRKQVIKSSPIQCQYCDSCENESTSQDFHVVNEKGVTGDKMIIDHQDQ